jgi:putative transposase
LVAHPKDYRWSSYQRRALGMPDRSLDEDPWYAGLGTTETERRKKYQEWMESQIGEREWEEIRQATQRARLIGRETFQKQVEAMTGWPLVGEARGRVKKASTIAAEKVL